MAALGKALSEASFTIMYLFTTELYPTVVRLVNNKVTTRSQFDHRQWSSNLLWPHVLQVYMNLSAFIFQTEWFRLHLVLGTAGRVHISAHHAIGGRVASLPCSHLLCGGSRVWFSGFTPAWNIKRPTAWAHRGYWETKVMWKHVKRRSHVIQS